MSLQHQAPMQAFTSLGLLTETAGGGEYYHNKTYLFSLHVNTKQLQIPPVHEKKAKEGREQAHTQFQHTGKLGLVFSYKTQECVWQSEITESTTYLETEAA